jgi:hypothetical protein
MWRALTVFESFVRHFKEKALHGVHPRCFLRSDRKEWCIKEGNVILQEEAMLGVDLISFG